VPLKSVLYEHILPAWNAFSNNYMLEMDDIIMRSKEWAVIHPKTPDIDAINTKKFWKEAKNAVLPVFKGGRTIVHFHIPNPIFEKYIDCRINQDQMAEHENLTRITSYKEHQPLDKMVIFC